MEKITEKEMLVIMGGKLMELSACDLVIAEGNAHGNDPDYDWDGWNEAFDNACL